MLCSRIFLFLFSLFFFLTTSSLTRYCCNCCRGYRPHCCCCCHCFVLSNIINFNRKLCSYRCLCHPVVQGPKLMRVVHLALVEFVICRCCRPPIPLPSRSLIPIGIALACHTLLPVLQMLPREISVNPLSPSAATKCKRRNYLIISQCPAPCLASHYGGSDPIRL